VRQTDQQTTTDASDTDAMNPALAGGESDGALLRVQALVARGATPTEVAEAIGPRPSPRVMTYLHQTVGNGFVQQVMFAGSGGGGGGGPQPNTQPTQPLPPTTQPTPAPSPPVLANAPQPQQSQQPTMYHPPANAFVVNVRPVRPGLRVT